MIINANGIQVNCELSGKKQAPVVVLSHSLACSMVMWQPQLEMLESRFRVLRYDTRGHGGTDAPPGSYTLAQLVDDAIGILDGLDIERVHWVGLSMGGMIGQGLALSHPGRLNSLVLADTAAIIPDEAQPVWQERIDVVRNEGLQAVAESTLERWFTPNYLKQKLPEVDQIRQQILVTPVAGYIGCSEAIRRLNYLDQLAAIQTPTLVMVGADDPGTPVAASEAMHAHIKGSNLAVIPAAAHLSNIEQAKVFNTHLMAHLKRH
ncbi:MAG: 3-oxoadipate enol-lactonase [Desulfobacterales bacterium]|nr:3-oxoadipate enol-lactonase [Desulfobacterales bacterium]